jgi:N-acyl-D-amino-acid deacylase
MRYFSWGAAAVLVALACVPRPKKQYDLILRQGTIYDGTGGTPFVGDVAVQADTIAAVGDLQDATGKKEINIAGLAIAPGFINMLSWADQSLLKDGRSMSDIKQGVTLEVFGEGWSPGPMKRKSKTPPRQPLDHTGWIF